ncbi:PE-PPE domain-containing protein [Mycolicibacterium sp. Dal123E01]|uniref:PE-PPE domain-containing protein n=1 Tax=Mycolicibacterium sp. Dal123E01 TaxID=3457578 RepID=UPI00403E79C6
MGNRIAVLIGAAALAVTASVIPPAASADEAPPDMTALIVCGTGCPKADDATVDLIMSQFITPTHPGLTIAPVAVTTPEELWPATGLLRLVGLGIGDPKLFRLDGPAWPDQPWWKLSGLFDLTANQSVQLGAADLEAAMAVHGNDHLVIYGYSQGAGVANVVKKRLAEQYPGPGAPDIDFVLGGDPNLPNGGLMSRFAGAYIPLLDFPFNGPAATDTPFTTVEVNRQYDGFADFPLYPLNVIADLNAVLGMFYVHSWPFAVSLAPSPPGAPTYQGTYGDTSYYFFENENLPLFGPLRTLGVPEKLIDIVEPFFRVIVEAGYDRSIKPWVPTPARLIPNLNPGKLAEDLGAAINEGLDNARTLFGAGSSGPSGVGGPAPHASTAASARPSTRSITASRQPTRHAPRSQAISPSHGSDRDARGTSARHH